MAEVLTLETRSDNAGKTVTAPLSFGAREIVLFHSSGDDFSIAPEIWVRLLESAKLAGWAAQGSFAPPTPLDKPHVRWDGDYNRPHGQTVLRGDARALGQALKRAVETMVIDGPDISRALALSRFAETSGFLICS